MVENESQMIVTKKSPIQIADNSGQLRHELKYVVPADLLQEIRSVAEPFCIPDPATTGTPPEYRVTTLQLDTEGKSLHFAKERERLNRFKLRIRTYGDPGEFPEFLEIKHKQEHMIQKSRCKLSPSTFNKAFLFNDPKPKDLNKHAEQTYWDFVRLVNELDARPVVLIRYIRESWVGKNNQSTRITFDRHLEYALTKKWSLEKPKRWRRMDTATAFQLSFSPMILEMKSSSQVPNWMLELVRFFSLQRVGFCKYSTAMRLESLFEGNTYSDASENTSYW